MGKGLWAGCVALVAALAGASSAYAGSYQVVSCGAPGARGVNHAWTTLDYDARFWDVAASCPALTVYSNRTPGGVTVPNWSGAGFEINAPAGAVLDDLVIWRWGDRFNSTGTDQGPWVVQGYDADAQVIGGAFTGETCHFPSGNYDCHFGDPTAMSAASKVDRDIETPRIFYSAACFDGPGCTSANAQGIPFATLQIFGSIVTVRDSVLPTVIARGGLLAGGWQTTDAPLSFGASDAVGIKQVRVLVDANPVRSVRPACDFTYMVPCGQVAERSLSLGDDLPDGRHTLRVEAMDSADNVAVRDTEVAVDRHAPELVFVPSGGGRTVRVDVSDPGSGVTGGTIEVRRRHVFQPLATTLANGRLVARLDHGTRRGKTFRVTATDAVGHQAQMVGSPVRLRAGFGRRYRSSARGSVRRTTLVHGRLRADDGSPLANQTITISQRVRVDGAPLPVVARATTGGRGAFHVRIPAGPSRVLQVDSPGSNGLLSARRTLRLRVPWSSSLHIRPRHVAVGGTIRLSGRLVLRGATLPPSGKLLDLQAFDRGRWRVFATTRARGERASWRARYHFGARGRGSYRIRVRIRREGTLPFELGYSRPATVHVG
jgi:hypothetical protein